MDIAPGATADGRPARSVAGRVRAAWYLRRLRSVGPGAEVSGNPDLQASDLVVGKQFKVYSGHRRTLVCGWAGSGSATAACSTAAWSSSRWWA